MVVMVPSYSVRETAGAVLAGEQPPLTIARVAVGEVRRLAEDARLPRLLVPAHDPVVRDVAPQDIAPVPEPRRTFGPAEARDQPLDLGGVEPVAREARVDDLDRRVGVALARLPLREGARGHGQRCRGGPSCQERSSDHH